MGGKGKKVIRETFCAFNWQPSLDFNYARSSPPQAYLLSITHLKQEILSPLCENCTWGCGYITYNSWREGDHTCEYLDF